MGAIVELNLEFQFDSFVLVEERIDILICAPNINCDVLIYLSNVLHVSLICAELWRAW